MIAEGVEISDQLAFLAARACERDPGYYRKPPREADALAKCADGKRAKHAS